MIINRGKIVAQGTPESLSETINKGANKMQVRVKGEREQILNGLKEFSVIKVETAITGVEKGTIDLTLSNDNGEDIREAIFRAMAKSNSPILLMKSTEMSLEEIFLSITDADRMGISAFADFEQAEETTETEVEDNDSDL